MISQLQQQIATLKPKNENSYKRKRGREEEPRSPPRRRQSPRRSSPRRYRSNQRPSDDRRRNEPNQRFDWSMKRSTGYQRDGPNKRLNWSKTRSFDNRRDAPNKRFEFNRSQTGRMENNRHSDNQQKNQRQPEPSKNEDFPQMVKLLNRAVSVRHHSSNWKSFPVHLSTQLDEVVQGVQPPAQNEEFNKELETITDQFKKDIVSAVQRHLTMVLYKTGEVLTKMDTLDLERAKSTASKQIKINLRKKISEPDLEHWMKLAADLVGTHPNVQKQNGEPSEKKTKTDQTKGLTEEPTTNKAPESPPTEIKKEKRTPKVIRKTSQRCRATQH